MASDDRTKALGSVADAQRHQSNGWTQVHISLRTPGRLGRYRILAPEKKLQYTWRGKKDQATGEFKFDTLLTLTLSPNADGGTHLHLLHEGFEPDDFALKVMGDGWKSHTVSRIHAVLKDLA